MGWIGLSDNNNTSVFRRGGLQEEAAQKLETSVDQVLATGSLWIEFNAHVDQKRHNILKYGAREPFVSGLTVSLESDSSITVMLGQGDRHETLRLPTELDGRENNVLLGLSWCIATRTINLAIHSPDTGHFHHAELRGTMPLSTRDWRRVIESKHHTQVDPSVNFWAVSDSVEPFGISATFGAHCLVETPRGRVAVSDLRPGQFIKTIDGDLAQVRWVGSQWLPARGRFTPHLIRAPYFGAEHDLIMSAEQKLCLQGSEIEYVFGLERVGVRVSQMQNTRSILPVKGVPVVEYHQVLLDRPTIFSVSGVNVTGLDPWIHTNDRTTLRHSLVRDLPYELIPAFEPLEMYQLKPFESASLNR